MFEKMYGVEKWKNRFNVFCACLEHRHSASYPAPVTAHPPKGLGENGLQVLDVFLSFERFSLSFDKSDKSLHLLFLGQLKEIPGHK